MRRASVRWRPCICNVDGSSYGVHDGGGGGPVAEDYGDRWWLEDGSAFRASGICGQSIYLNPDEDLAIVVQGAWPQATGGALRIALRCLLPGGRTASAVSRLPMIRVRRRPVALAFVVVWTLTAGAAFRAWVRSTPVGAVS